MKIVSITYTLHISCLVPMKPYKFHYTHFLYYHYTHFQMGGLNGT